MDHQREVTEMRAGGYRVTCSCGWWCDVPNEVAARRAATRHQAPTVQPKLPVAPLPPLARVTDADAHRCPLCGGWRYKSNPCRNHPRSRHDY